MRVRAFQDDDTITQAVCDCIRGYIPHYADYTVSITLL
jgi:hypothetical protein